MTRHETLARAIADQCACLRARRAARSLTNLYDDLLRPSGIEMTQLSVLAAIAHFGAAGAPLGVLADVLALDRTTLTRNLIPLDKADLVRVARSPTDARAKLVLLTRSGERTIEEAFPLWEKAQQRVRERVGRTHVETMIEELEHLSARMGREDSQPPPQRKRASRPKR